MINPNSDVMFLVKEHFTVSPMLFFGLKSKGSLELHGYCRPALAYKA